MNPEELEELLGELLRGVQDVLQSGEILSDEFQGMLAQTLTALTDRIDELRAGGAPQAPEDPDVNPAPYPSSNINGFRYDPASGRLFVKFQGKYPQQNGPVYSYDNVPPFIFDVFRRGAVAPRTSGRNAWHRWREGITPSLGASMHALIKLGGYNYHRLS